MKFIIDWEKMSTIAYEAIVKWLKQLPSDQEISDSNPAKMIFVCSLDFSEISEWKGLNALGNFRREMG